MLIEKEIADSVLKHGHYHNGEFRLAPSGIQALCEDLSVAIAKRLSEGVVWSGEGRVDHTTEEFESMTSIEMRSAAGIGGICDIGELIGVDGQLVSVTVKIVEETKDES